MDQTGERVPLLEAEQILLFGWGPEQATSFEREVIERRAIEVVSAGDVTADPEGAATSARRLIESRCDRLLVLDVDVIDFADVPLSENCGRNEGLSFEHALRALDAVLRSPRLAGLTITELNPDHAERGAGGIERFATAVAERSAGAAPPFDESSPVRQPTRVSGKHRRPAVGRDAT